MVIAIDSRSGFSWGGALACWRDCFLGGLTTERGLSNPVDFFTDLASFVLAVDSVANPLFFLCLLAMFRQGHSYGKVGWSFHLWRRVLMSFVSLLRLPMPVVSAAERARPTFAI